MADQLVQNGLALVRDVRVAYADLAVAYAQWQLGEEAVKIRQSIADLTRKRLERGDISELEEMTVRIDALTARATAAALEQNVVVASARLRQLMGLPVAAPELRVELSAPPVATDIDVSALTDQALANRPDLHAATWAVDAAAKRAGWRVGRFCVSMPPRMPMAPARRGLKSVRHCDSTCRSSIATRAESCVPKQKWSRPSVVGTQCTIRLCRRSVRQPLSIGKRKPTWPS